MKKVAVFFILILITLAACEKQRDKKLEAYSPEAFAYSLPDGWEVNATVRVRGFDEDIKDKVHNAKLAYSVDLLTPAGRTMKAVAADTVDEKNQEEFIDLPVDAQLDLDSTYVPGKYKVIFNIRDLLSGQEVNLAKEFELTK
ncbi:MAG: hypothetical protein ACM3S2_22325 [Ignavibacteriales bacterium]